MITLAAPCRALMEPDPLTVTTEYLVDDDLRADQGEPLRRRGRRRRSAPARGPGHPLGPRRARRAGASLLVDHAEQAQSVSGIEEAEIVEILDHHHIGSIETRIPVTATFDPVGSTATLVVERFRQSGMEPSRPTALMLLGAVLSDTVILNSATTTERDHAVVDYLERVLAVDGAAVRPRDVRGDLRRLGGERRGDRHPRRQAVPASSGHQICIAQIEVVGKALLERKPRAARGDAQRAREPRAPALRADGHRRADKGTDLLVAGDVTAVARASAPPAHDSLIELPGVMSRKKEVAPKLLDGALGAATRTARRRRARAGPRPTAARAGSTRACPA